MFISVILCGNIGKLEAFIVFVYDYRDWLKCFHTKKLPFKIESKNIIFHKPAFHQLINSSSGKHNHVNVGRAYCRRTIENDPVIIWIITYIVFFCLF